MARTATRRTQRVSLSKGDQREQDLLSAAHRMLAAGRFAAASVSELTAEAGISRATFYFYFASKQELLSAVIAAAVAELELTLARPPDAAESGRTTGESVAEMVQAARDLWWHHRVVLVASVELGAVLPDVYERNLDSIRAISRATVALLDDTGDRDDELTHRLVEALVLMTERNLYDLARRKASRAEYDELTSVLSTIWLRALGLEG